MLRKLISVSLPLILTTQVLALPIPDKCPDANAIKTMPFVSIRNEAWPPHTYELKTDKFKFNTSTEWYITIIVVANSKDEAIEKAHAGLSKSAWKGPIQVDHDDKVNWLCTIHKGSGYKMFGAFASTENVDSIFDSD